MAVGPCTLVLLESSGSRTWQPPAPNLENQLMLLAGGAGHQDTGIAGELRHLKPCQGRLCLAARVFAPTRGSLPLERPAWHCPNYACPQEWQWITTAWLRRRVFRGKTALATHRGIRGVLSCPS